MSGEFTVVDADAAAREGSAIEPLLAVGPDLYQGRIDSAAGALRLLAARAQLLEEVARIRHAGTTRRQDLGRLTRRGADLLRAAGFGRQAVRAWRRLPGISRTTALRDLLLAIEAASSRRRAA